MNIFLRRYWLPLILIIVGSLVALCGVGTATIWKPSSQVSASLPTSSQKQTLAITRPGMFELYNSPTKITVSGQGKVALAIGRSTDVTAWAADQNYVEVTGQKDDHTLLTEPHPGKADPRQPGEAAGKDMWVKFKEVDTGQISETWDRSEGAWSLIAWSEEGNVQLTMQWNQAAATPWFWPLLIAGLLLILIGAVVAVVINRLAAAAAKEEAEVRKRREQQAQEAAAAQSEQTVQIPALDAVSKPPSRSELRKARERGEATIEVEGVKFPTGLVPVIRTDADGQAINPAAAVSPQPEVTDTSELPAPTRPATELSEATHSPEPAAYSPTPVTEPGTSLNPAVSQEPAQSAQPAASYNPAQSAQPAVSYNPAVSQEPAQSAQPAQSYQPAASYNPAVSQEPAQLYQPAASYNPTESAQPAQSYQPANSYHPPAERTNVSRDQSEEWFENEDFDLDGLGEGPDVADFEGESTFDQRQGGNDR